MEYIYKKSVGNGVDVWSLDLYKEYINKLDLHLSQKYEKIINMTIFQFQGDEEIHDAWMCSLTVEEKFHNSQKDNVVITMELIGPYHDKKFIIKYYPVLQYECKFKASWVNNFHGDVDVMEFIADEDKIKHTIIFTNGEITIIAKECTIEVVPWVPSHFQT